MTDLKEKLLPKVFDKNVRPFLDAIDNLRNFGLDECIKLPTVIVIGDQSSGKSSILEAISGIQLPRGAGMVTRCPLQLQMKHKKHSTKWSATLKYRDQSNEKIETDLKDPSEVEDAIKRAQEDVLNSEDGISESLLTLTVEDQHVPDLTLIDLPGIARVSVGEQADNLPEQIIRLLKKYVSRKESIILTVCPCTADLATTEALKLAKEYDPDSARTYGVLTKADLIDKGNEDSILKILNNEVVPLSKGYTLVRCRGQHALLNKQSLKDTLEKEKEFFTTHEIFRDLTKDQWGIDSLSQKLATDLLNFIKREIPNIRSSISEKLMSISKEEMKLKFDYPTTPETKLNFVLNKTYEFLSQLNDLVEGKYWSDELENIETTLLTRSVKPDMRLIPHSRRAFDVFHQRLIKITPENSIDKTIQDLLKIGQGKEPREFLSYDTFKKIALKFVQHVEPYLQDCMDDIYNNLQSVLDVLGSHYFGKYPVFKADFLIIIFDTLAKCKDKCINDLEMLVEKEKVFFTMDRNYEEKIDSLEALQEVKYTLRKDWLQYFLVPKQTNKPKNMKKELPKYIIVYYLLAIGRISDQMSQTILYLLMNKLHTTLKQKLPSHVARPEVYDLLDADCVGIEDKKSTLKYKIQGLKKGIQEVDKLIFCKSQSNNGERQEREGSEKEKEVRKTRRRRRKRGRKVKE